MRRRPNGTERDHLAVYWVIRTLASAQVAADRYRLWRSKGPTHDAIRASRRGRVRRIRNRRGQASSNRLIYRWSMPTTLTGPTSPCRP